MKEGSLWRGNEEVFGEENEEVLGECKEYLGE